MAVPSPSPAFATDATYTADADAWAGDDNTVDPGATVRAEGFQPGVLPAEWLNFMINLIGQWLIWIMGRLGGMAGTGEWTYETAKVREVWIDPRHIVSGRNELDAGVYTSVTSDNLWRPYEITIAGPPDIVQPTGWVSTSRPGLFGHVALDWIPSGATLSAAQLYCDKGTSQAASADQIQFAVVKRAISVAATALSSPTAETVVASGSVGTGTGPGGLTLTSIGEVFDRSLYTYALRVRSSQGADTTADKVGGFRVQFSDPGPRND